MQRPHPSFGRCLSLSCLGVADAVARGCRCSRSRRGRSVHGRSSRQPRTSSRTPPQGQGSLRPCSELAFFLRTPIPKCGRLPHRSTQASLAAVLRVRRAAFFLSSLFGSYFLFMVAGEVPAVPEQQLRLPHRSRRQNEVPVVRWRGLSTYPNRHGTCLSVTPYGRHARCGSLWCPFPAVVRPSWSTEF